MVLIDTRGTKRIIRKEDIGTQSFYNMLKEKE
jgi:hypothetical protein